MLSSTFRSTLRAAAPRTARFSTAPVLRTPPKPTNNTADLFQGPSQTKKTTGTAAASSEAAPTATLAGEPSPAPISPFGVQIKDRQLQNKNLTSSLKSDHLRKFLLNDKIAVVTG